MERNCESSVSKAWVIDEAPVHTCMHCKLTWNFRHGRSQNSVVLWKGKRVLPYAIPKRAINWKQLISFPNSKWYTARKERPSRSAFCLDTSCRHVTKPIPADYFVMLIVASCRDRICFNFFPPPCILCPPLTGYPLELCIGMFLGVCHASRRKGWSRHPAVHGLSLYVTHQ